MGNKKYGLSCGDPQTLYLWVFIYNVSIEVFSFLDATASQAERLIFSL